SWQCKKQKIVATSTIKAEYVAAANCYGQVLWIQNQMLDYGFNFINTKIYIDNESTICIVKNLVFHFKTKHIEIRHHFIRDAYEKKLIQVLKIHTDDNVADLLTKAFDVSRHQELASPKQTVFALAIPGQTATGKESSNPLMADNLPKTIQSNDLPLSRGYILRSGEDSLELIELMETAALCTMEDEVQGISATIDRQVKVLVSEASIRRHLKLEDSEGLSSLPNAEIFEQMANMGVHSLRRDEGSLSLNELTVLCTSLSKKVASLESKLKQTKETYSTTLTKLILRVKKLEKQVQYTNSRRKM
ncbi:hypothetical protein Tco_1442503, partial [Tanacetum coccineum]